MSQGVRILRFGQVEIDHPQNCQSQFEKLSTHKISYKTFWFVKQVSTGLMSVATQKELQELNISLLLNPASWIEGMNDEADFDVLNLNE